MSRHLFGDPFEYVLSRFPDEVVTHFANSKSEFLRGVRACVENCLDGALRDVEATLEGSRRRRNKAASRDAEQQNARVDIEEEEDA